MIVEGRQCKQCKNYNRKRFKTLEGLVLWLTTRKRTIMIKEPWKKRLRKKESLDLYWCTHTNKIVSWPPWLNGRTSSVKECDRYKIDV